MSYEVLYFLIVLVQNIIITTYLDSVLDYKLNRKLSNLLVYLFLTILFIATTPIINLKPLKLLIITVVQIVGFRLFSHNTWKDVIKKTIILVALTMLAEIISNPIYMAISAFNNTRVDIDTASTFDTLRVLAGSYLLPVFMCIILTYCIHYKKIKGPVKRKLVAILFIIPIVLTFMHYVIYSYNIETFSDTTILFLFVSSIVFMLLQIIMYRLIMELETFIKHEQELELLKQKEEMQLEYYRIMHKKEEEIRKINHDIKNNLQVIYTLENDDDKQKLVDKITANLKKYELVKYSTNDILNIILNTKINEAKSNGIDVSVSLSKKINFVEDLDISNLFSNILDNAIDNAKRASVREISLSVYKKLNFIVINCANTYDGIIELDKNKNIKTRKKDKHGFGIKIIKDIVKKYDGEIDISFNEEKFSITIMLPEKSK